MPGKHFSRPLVAWLVAPPQKGQELEARTGALSNSQYVGPAAFHLQNEAVTFMAQLWDHLAQHTASLVQRPKVLPPHPKGLPLPVIAEAASAAANRTRYKPTVSKVEILFI